MTAWILFLIITLLFLLVELFVSTLFFLNFALSALLCFGLSFYTEDYRILTPSFVFFALVSLYIFRPFYKKNTSENKDFTSQYINKEATAISDITFKSGRIKIYDETWQARLLNNDSAPIEKGQNVKILKQDNLTMYVELS